MITLKNADAFEVDWYVCPRFLCDTSHATASGTLPAGASTVVETENAQTVLWAFGMKFAAGVGAHNNSIVTFKNDETGTWCMVSEPEEPH